MAMTILPRSRPLTVATVLGSAGLLISCQYLPLPSSKSPSPLPETQLIPERSGLILSFQTDPQQIQGPIPVETESWQSEVQDETGVTWEQDIQPWIGETISIAVVEPNLTPEAEEPTAGLLLVACTRHPQASRTLLQQYPERQRQERGAEFEERRQGQVQLVIEVNAAVGEQRVLAAFGEDYVAFSNDLEIMEEAIATFQGQGTPISADPAFTSVLTDLWQPETFAFAYLGPQVFGDEDLISAYDLDLSAQQAASLQGIQTVAGVGQWLPQGLRIRGQANVDPESAWTSVAADPVSGQVLQRLPSQALAVITGGALAQSWARNLQQIQSDPQAKAALDQLRQQVRTTTQLDLEQDLIQWLDGEFAAVLLQENNPLTQGLGLTVLMQTSQRQQVNTSLDQLDTVIGRYGVTVDQAGDQVIWRAPLIGRPLVYRSWVEDYLVWGSSESAVSGVVQTAADRLLDTEPYQTLYEILPQPNYGYLMMDLQQGLEWGEARTGSGELVDPEAQAAAETFTGLGLTGYPVDTSRYRLDLVLTVKQ